MHVLCNVALERSRKLWQQAGVDCILQLCKYLHELQCIIQLAGRQRVDGDGFRVCDCARCDARVSAHA